MDLRFELVGLILLSMAFAGCAGNAGNDADHTTEVVRPTGTGTANTTTGKIEGNILDQFSAPVPNAQVVLAGTNHARSADGLGTFVIAGVRPGTYTISASRENYTLEAEKKVEVAAGLTTRVNLTMISSTTDPGARPHPHDWWAGEKDIVIMDRDLDLDGNPACLGGVALKGCTLPLGTEFVIRFKSVEEPNVRPNIVFQGTGKFKVEVTVATSIRAMDLLVKMPHEAALKKIMAFDGGTDATTIDVVPEAWDASHVRTSQWYFELRCQNAAVVSEPCGAQGPIHFKVTVSRGSDEIPLEIAHPDMWGALTQEKVLEDTCNWIFVPASVTYLYQTAQPQCASGLSVPVGKHVRPSTGVLRVTLEYENEVPVPVKFGLLYRPASLPLFQELGVVKKETPAATPGGKEVRVFDLELRPEQWDSPYAGTKEFPSRWAFFVYMTEPVPPSDQLGNRNAVFSGDIKFKVEIFKEGVTPPAP